MAKRRAELRRAAKAVGWKLLERGEHGILHRDRNALPLGDEASGFTRHHLGDDRLRGTPGEWRVTDQHFVGHRTERIHIAACRDLPFAHRLFG